MKEIKSGKIRICTSHMARDGHVFFETKTGWALIPNEKSKGKKIILCSMCDKPAVELDHAWPYFTHYNRCKDHIPQE